MASISKGGGPSFTEAELQDPDPPEAIRIYRYQIGVENGGMPVVEEGDDVSAGKDSSASSETDERNDDSEQHNPSSPVHETENPSAPDSEGFDDVDSADGKQTPKKSAPRRRSTRVVDSKKNDDFF